MMIKNTNVLITSAGQRVALVRGFQEALRKFFPEAKVYTTDMNPRLAPAAYASDGCFEVMPVTAKDYIPQILQLCQENNIGMIVPTIDTELLVLSESKYLFEQNHIAVSVSSPEFIKVCRDKRKTAEFFVEKGIRTPRIFNKNNLTFPIFAKPYDGSLSANIHYIKNSEELTKEILEDPKMIFMEFVDRKEYKEYTVDLYYGSDHKVKCIVPRERIKVRAGEINKGITEKDPLTGYLYDKLETIEGCVGCICLQVFLKPGTCDVIGFEINPRFGGGYPLTHAAGGNYTELLIREYFLGEEVNYFDDWKDHLLMLRYDDAVFV